MKKAIYNTLTESEKLLVAETSREALAEVDEDQLLELLTRVRRARTKYVKLYRRRASAQVSESGGRGLAHPINQRNRDKAEVFEIALARVSKQVDVVARRAAAQLKSERLAAARAAKSPPATSSGGNPAARRTTRAAAGAGSTGRARATTKTTGGLKRDASSRAAGVRRQAARDSR